MSRYSGPGKRWRPTVCTRCGNLEIRHMFAKTCLKCGGKLEEVKEPTKDAE